MFVESFVERPCVRLNCVRACSWHACNSPCVRLRACVNVCRTFWLTPLGSADAAWTFWTWTRTEWPTSRSTGRTCSRRWGENSRSNVSDQTRRTKHAARFQESMVPRVSTAAMDIKREREKCSKPCDEAYKRVSSPPPYRANTKHRSPMKKQQIDKNFHPTFTSRLQKFIKRQDRSVNGPNGEAMGSAGTTNACCAILQLLGTWTFACVCFACLHQHMHTTCFVHGRIGWPADRL